MGKDKQNKVAPPPGKGRMRPGRRGGVHVTVSPGARTEEVTLRLSQRLIAWAMNEAAEQKVSYKLVLIRGLRALMEDRDQREHEHLAARTMDHLMELMGVHDLSFDGLIEVVTGLKMQLGIKSPSRSGRSRTGRSTPSTSS